MKEGTVTKYYEALDNYNEAIEQDSAFISAYLGRSLAWEKTTCYTNALNDAVFAISLNSRYALSHIRKG